VVAGMWLTARVHKDAPSGPAERLGPSLPDPRRPYALDPDAPRTPPLPDSRRTEAVRRARSWASASP